MPGYFHGYFRGYRHIHWSTYIFLQYDADKNGIIDFKEFIALCMSLNDSDTEKAVAKLFSAVDKDGDKYVTFNFTNRSNKFNL